jgi:hypothetical protein
MEAAKQDRKNDAMSDFHAFPLHGAMMPTIIVAT